MSRFSRVSEDYQTIDMLREFPTNVCYKIWSHLPVSIRETIYDDLIDWERQQSSEELVGS